MSVEIRLSNLLSAGVVFGEHGTVPNSFVQKSIALKHEQSIPLKQWGWNCKQGNNTEE